jgi:hypothetical protein
MKEKRGDKIKPAFKRNGEFNFDNWLSPEFNEIRDILEKLTNFGSKDYKSKNFKIEYLWYADEKYYFIYYLPEDFLYIINWYKSRGAVDSFLFQGSPIRKDDFVYLSDKLKSRDRKT